MKKGKKTKNKKTELSIGVIGLLVPTACIFLVFYMYIGENEKYPDEQRLIEYYTQRGCILNNKVIIGQENGLRGFFAKENIQPNTIILSGQGECVICTRNYFS